MAQYWEEEANASKDEGNTISLRTRSNSGSEAHDNGKLEDDYYPPRHTHSLAGRRRHQRRRQKMMHIDTTDPRLDMALHFVSRGPLADLAQERATVDPLVARRRGRAIYLNDLLQFSGKEQASHFYSALLQWREAQGDENGEMGEEDEQDMIVLLAQARTLAQTPPSSFSPRQDNHRRRLRRSMDREKAMADLRTSASTPEGALGRPSQSLPLEIILNSTAWEEEDKQEVLSSSDDEDEKNDFIEGGADEAGVLRAGLRFILGCYDDLVKKNKSICNHPEHKTSSTDDSPVGPTPVRTRSRSRSLIKSLAIKGASLTSDRSNRYSLSSSIGQESVLDLDTAGLDQIAGPSSRYGMASVSALVSPTTEEKDPMDKASPALLKGKSSRRSSDASLLSSPVWSRRPSKLEAPCEQDEASTEQINVSHSSLASALQQMRRLDRSKLQSNSLSAPSADSHSDEALREERVKTAALSRELETLRASLGHQESPSIDTAELSDIERGARSDEEAMMMQAVAQAARDTVEAEEREAEWKAECEVITERVNVLEEALYQAMGLLAGKEQDTQSNRGGFAEPLAFTAVSPREIDGRISGASSPFYSAAEEDDVEDETPFASLSRKAGSDFAATLEHYSKTGSDTQPFPQCKQADGAEGEAGVESRNDSTVKVAGWDQSDTPLHSESETSIDCRLREGSLVAESVLASPRSSASGPAGSRRDSHASWVRHSILPPRLPRPTSPLPSLPTSSSEKTKSLERRSDPVPVLAEKESPVLARIHSDVVPVKQEESSLETEKPFLGAGIIDYSKRAKAKTSRSSLVEKDTIEEGPASPPSGHVSLYSNVRSAIVEEMKSAPVVPAVSIHPEQSSDETSSFDAVPDPWSPTLSRTTSMKIDGRTPSFTDTVRSRGSTSHSSSSNSSRDKVSRSKTATSKLSILGHMPPSYHAGDFSRRTLSSTSLLSSDTQPSSVSTGISEHYERLAARKLPPANPTFFARRTRFTAS